MHDGHDHPPPRRRPGPGHNHNARVTAQWQAPQSAPAAPPEHEADFDLVEAAFCRAAATADDATSLLRLAGIPFVGMDTKGATLRLLAYRIEEETEVGAVSPGFGAGDVVYHPVPGSRVKSLRRLVFAYHAADGIRRLSLAEARALKDATTTV